MQNREGRAAKILSDGEKLFVTTNIFYKKKINFIQKKDSVSGL
jgi:hypothetical protein